MIMIEILLNIIAQKEAAAFIFFRTRFKSAKYQIKNHLLIDVFDSRKKY